MSDRYFAVSIDGTDWSDEVFAVRLHMTATILASDGEALPRPGQLTTSLGLTFRKSDDAETLVGTVPRDGHAEVLLIMANESDDLRSVVAYHMEATTLLPPWDTDVDVGGVECFESTWYIKHMTTCRYRFP